MTGRAGDRLPDGAAGAIAEFVAVWRKEQDIPGVSVAAFDGDGVRYADGFGVRDQASGEAATADTLYAVGSVTKPVTALAVLQLVDRGEVALDDAVGEYVTALSDSPGEPITVRDLLSHSSGMPRTFVSEYEERRIDEGEDLLSYVDAAADQRLTDRPRYAYSNAGYFVLAAMLEAVDGRSYATYVREEVFAPLGMDRSGFDPSLLESDADAMTGHVREDDDLVASTVDESAGAAGGLITSVAQLVPLLRCVLNGGGYGAERLLSPGLVDEACRVQSPLLPADDGKRRGYGYGWELEEFLGETLVAHRGGIGVSGGYVGLLRERGVGVALAYNALGRPTIPYAQGVLALACGEDPEAAVPLLRVYDVVETVAGTYSAYRDAMTVTVTAGPAATIRVEPDEGPSFTATPRAVDEAPYVFAQTMGGGVRWLAEFHEDDGGMELVLSTGKWTTRLAAVGDGDGR